MTTAWPDWRGLVAGTALVGSVVGLGAVTWSALRMTWFLRTSPFCDANPCTAAAAERSLFGDAPTTLLTDAHDAALAAGVPFLDLLYPPILLLVLVVLAATFWVGVLLALQRPTRNRAVVASGAVVAAMLVVLVALAPTTLAFSSWMLE